MVIRYSICEEEFEERKLLTSVYLESVYLE